MRIYYRSNTIHLRHLSYFDSNVDVKLQGLKNVFFGQKSFLKGPHPSGIPPTHREIRTFRENKNCPQSGIFTAAAGKTN